MSNFWKDIWDSKGSGDSDNLLFLDGYEHLDIEIHSKELVDGILFSLGIEKGQSILEVGCGAGFLAREMSDDFSYSGIDYSQSIIEKHKKLFPRHHVTCAEAVDIPFENDSFDFAFCFGVYQYLPSEEYADQMIKEMKRVARKGVFLGDLKENATREEHLPCPKERLLDKGFKLVESFYDSDDCYRYNVHLDLENGDRDDLE